jgi:hypothetical protein
MKKEARTLLSKATDSLILSIEHFNRPTEQGRIVTVLILLDHSMEMLLKASIIERGSSIQNKSRPGQTIGFDQCVGRALSDGEIQFLNEDEARLLRSINAQRDGAQHYLIDISENMLYIYVQSGLTVFRDILDRVFGYDLNEFFPERVLPVSTTPPLDIEMLFEKEVEQIKELLRPNTRKRLDAESRLRSLILFDEALISETLAQPSKKKMNSLIKQLRANTNWKSLFPNIITTEISAKGEGHKISLHINKKEGLPVTIAESGEDGFPVVVKEVNDFDRYSMNFRRLCSLLGLNQYEMQALLWYTDIKSDSDCYKEFKRGAVVIKGYSQKALQKLRTLMQEESITSIVEKYKEYRRNN